MMKIWLATAAACMALSGVALAQQAPSPEAQAFVAAHPSRCPAIPPAPELAESGRGRSADNRMDAGNERYNAWLAEIGPALVCRQAEVRELRAAAEAANALYFARGQEFNAGVAQQDSTCRTWQTELSEHAQANGRQLPDSHAAMCGAPQ